MAGRGPADRMRDARAFAMNAILGLSALTIAWVAGPTENREELLRRLHRAFGDTVDKLEKQDVGAGTRDLQKKIVEDLGKLIDPPAGKTNPPPADKNADTSKQAKPKGANDGTLAKQNTIPAAKESKLESSPAPAKLNGEHATPPDVSQKKPNGLRSSEKWGDLPPRVRQALDAYSGDRFMRRYEELLHQYFRGIAEDRSRRAGD